MNKSSITLRSSNAQMIHIITLARQGLEIEMKWATGLHRQGLIEQDNELAELQSALGNNC